MDAFKNEKWSPVFQYTWKVFEETQETETDRKKERVRERKREEKYNSERRKKNFAIFSLGK